MTAEEAMRLIDHNRWNITPSVQGGWIIDLHDGRELARSESRYLIDAVKMALRTLALDR